MFGQYYQQREAAAAAVKDNVGVKVYACQLLAEVLNRARVVENAFERMSEDMSPHDWAANEDVGDLYVALQHFSEDMEEARVRGRRMRLFAGPEWMDEGSIESDEDLAEIGGPLGPDPYAQFRRGV